MSKNKESRLKKFSALFRRIIAKQSKPENDVERFTKFIQETSSTSTEPPTKDQREKDFENKDGNEPNRQD